MKKFGLLILTGVLLLVGAVSFFQYQESHKTPISFGTQSCTSDDGCNNAKCNPGYYKSSSSSGNCIVCPKGSYCPGDDTKNSCPEGKTTTSTSCNSISLCNQNSDYYCSSGSCREQKFRTTNDSNAKQSCEASCAPAGNVQCGTSFGTCDKGTALNFHGSAGTCGSSRTYRNCRDGSTTETCYCKQTAACGTAFNTCKNGGTALQANDTQCGEPDTWKCTGENSVAECSLPDHCKVEGECGDDRGLCKNGSTVERINRTERCDNTAIWKCLGAHGGKNSDNCEYKNTCGGEALPDDVYRCAYDYDRNTSAWKIDSEKSCDTANPKDGVPNYVATKKYPDGDSVCATSVPDDAKCAPHRVYACTDYGWSEEPSASCTLPKQGRYAIQTSNSVCIDANTNADIDLRKYICVADKVWKCTDPGNNGQPEWKQSGGICKYQADSEVIEVIDASPPALYGGDGLNDYNPNYLDVNGGNGYNNEDLVCYPNDGANISNYSCMPNYQRTCDENGSWSFLRQGLGSSRTRCGVRTTKVADTTYTAGRSICRGELDPTDEGFKCEKEAITFIYKCNDNGDDTYTWEITTTPSSADYDPDFIYEPGMSVQTQNPDLAGTTCHSPGPLNGKCDYSGSDQNEPACTFGVPAEQTEPSCSEGTSWICYGKFGGEPDECTFDNEQTCSCDASTLPTDKDIVICADDDTPAPTKPNQEYADPVDCATSEFPCSYCLDPDKNGICGDQTPTPQCGTDMVVTIDKTQDATCNTEDGIVNVTVTNVDPDETIAKLQILDGTVVIATKNTNSATHTFTGLPAGDNYQARVIYTSKTNKPSCNVKSSSSEDVVQNACPVCETAPYLDTVVTNPFCNGVKGNIVAGVAGLEGFVTNFTLLDSTGAVIETVDTTQATLVFDGLGDGEYTVKATYRSQTGKEGCEIVKEQQVLLTPDCTEYCDGIDNNGANGVDEGCGCIHGKTQVCGNNIGQCTEGEKTCVNGERSECTGVSADAEEVCDGIDNNCSGVADEGCDCTNGDTQECGSDIGVCQKGQQTCSAGKRGACEGQVEGSAEVCDGKDNNCDGVTDEGFDDTDGDGDICLNTEIYDLALIKGLHAQTPGPFKIGDTVKFKVKVFNQGNVSAKNFTIIDYLPDGLDFATANTSYTEDSDGNILVEYNGDLKPGAETSFVLTFIINDKATPGDLNNIAEIISDDGDDVDSTPDDDATNDCLINDEINLRQCG